MRYIQPSVIFHPECHLRVIKIVIKQHRKIILLQQLKLYWPSPLYCICQQPYSPLNNPPLPQKATSNMLQRCPFLRIPLIRTGQGSEEASVRDAPGTRPCQYSVCRCMHPWDAGLRGCHKGAVTDQWNWICMRVCACVCVMAGVSLETSVSRGWPCSRNSNDLFTAHIALSANRSPAVFTSILAAHWFYKTTVKLAAASMFRMRGLYLDLSECDVYFSDSITKMSLDPWGVCYHISCTWKG